MRKKVSLLDLPDELLLHIFSRFEDQRDAAHLAMGNRRLFALGDIAMRRKFHRVRFVPSRISSRIPKLLVEVIKKPHLGEYVRHIELDCYMGYAMTGYPSKDGIDEADLKLLCDAIRDADIVGPEGGNVLGLIFPNPSYRERGESSYHKAAAIYAALMASLAPRLTSISCCDLGYYTPKAEFWEEDGEIMRMDSSDPGSRSYFGRFLERAAKSGKHLQNVRELRFLSDTGRYHDDRVYDEVDYYHGLNVVRRLPALMSISWDATTSSEQNMSVRPPPRSANYTRLAFRHSSVRSAILFHMIRSTKALTHLELTLGGRNMLGGHFHPLDLNQLLDALIEYRNTLEYLNIDAEDELMFGEYFNDVYRGPSFLDDEEEASEEMQYQEEWADELLDATSIIPSSDEAAKRSLRSLHRLKHLSIGIYTLYYWAQGIGSERIEPEAFSLVDQLPPTLEILRIYGIDGLDQPKYGETDQMQLSIKSQLSELMAQKGAKLPSLRNVEGIDKLIPNGSSVNSPDKDTGLLWKREIVDWPEEEDGAAKMDSH